MVLLVGGETGGSTHLLSTNQNCLMVLTKVDCGEGRKDEMVGNKTIMGELLFGFVVVWWAFHSLLSACRMNMTRERACGYRVVGNLHAECQNCVIFRL